MKQNNVLKSTAVALVMLFAVANKNSAQGNKPDGFVPVAPAKGSVSKDSVVKSDTLRADFKNNTVDADTGTKKYVVTPDMPLDDQAAIYSMNNDAVGIAIWKGKDMAKYTDAQMIQFYEGLCRDSGVIGKVFIGSTYTNNGNTTYAAFVNGTSLGGLMNGNSILNKENGLPFAIIAQKGLDNRRRRASLAIEQY